MNKRVLFFAITIAIIAALFTGSFIVVNKINDAFTGGIIFANEEGIGNFTTIKSRNSDPNTFAFAIREIYAGASGLTRKVNGVYVDNNFDGFYMKLVSGSWFSESDNFRENNNIVIDSRLAKDFFFSTDVVGKKIVIDQKVFTICGVYEFPLEIIETLSTNGRPFVFLASRPEDRTQVQYIHVANSDRILFEEEQRLILSRNLGIDAQTLFYSDISAKMQLINALPYIQAKILIFFILVLLILLISSFSIDSFTTGMMGKKYMGNTVILLMFGIAFVFLEYLLCTLPGIPEIYLPRTNIFDFAHYFELFVNEAQTGKSLLFNFTDKIFFASFIVLIAENILITFFSVPLFVMLYVEIKKALNSYIKYVGDRTYTEPKA